MSSALCFVDNDMHMQSCALLMLCWRGMVCVQVHATSDASHQYSEMTGTLLTAAEGKDDPLLPMFQWLHQLQALIMLGC